MVAVLTYSDALREVIKRWECIGGVPFLSPHWDNAGGVWDIGYGHVIKKGEDRRDISAEEAEMLLDWDLHFFDDALSAAITVPLASYEYDALMMMEYNTGQNNKWFRKVVECLNAGDVDGALAAWPNANTAQGVVNKGLVRRRASEINLFHTAEYRFP